MGRFIIFAFIKKEKNKAPKFTFPRNKYHRDIHGKHLKQTPLIHIEHLKTTTSRKEDNTPLKHLCYHPISESPSELESFLRKGLPNRYVLKWLAGPLRFYVLYGNMYVNPWDWIS